MCVELEEQAHLRSNESSLYQVTDLNQELQNVQAIMQEELFLSTLT